LTSGKGLIQGVKFIERGLIMGNKILKHWKVTTRIKSRQFPDLLHTHIVLVVGATKPFVEEVAKIRAARNCYVTKDEVEVVESEELSIESFK
jgi:hypothetical protein